MGPGYNNEAVNDGIHIMKNTHPHYLNTLCLFKM